MSKLYLCMALYTTDDQSAAQKQNTRDKNPQIIKSVPPKVWQGHGRLRTPTAIVTQL